MNGKRFYLGVAIAGAALGMFLGLGGLLPMPTIEIEWSGRWDEGNSVLPLASLDGGEETVVVYLGAASCGWSNVDDLPEAVRSIRDSWYAKAQAQERAFATVGVARDRIVEAGLDHLEKYGPFDEVVTGRGWLNMGFLQYVYGDLPGPAATPQIVVVERTVNRVAGQTWISDVRVVQRIVGADKILNWDAAGPEA